MTVATKLISTLLLGSSVFAFAAPVVAQDSGETPPSTAASSRRSANIRTRPATRLSEPERRPTRPAWRRPARLP